MCQSEEAMIVSVPLWSFDFILFARFGNKRQDQREEQTTTVTVNLTAVERDETGGCVEGSCSRTRRRINSDNVFVNCQ